MLIHKALKVNVIKFIKVAAVLCSKKGLKKLAAQLYDPSQSDERKAFSAALGVFLGIIPIWGFQTLSAIFLSVFFRLNKALVLIFSHISLPPLLPFVVFLSYKAGSFWVSDHNVNVAPAAKISGRNFSAHLLQYLWGSLTLAVVAAIIAGLITYAALKSANAIKQYRLAAASKREPTVSFAVVSGLLED
ncbi:DUF2062 domain-containing protein [Mucilaginibacter sp.]|uniref:DUF2062 domain-containing protein n=1 Tax=Mucilaginibacter sp. TaxID=1882438 RepID=UPI002843AE80|nr:DUF2062 domain-containing protein [Mucilaginibacter sp.]MDR3695626.1 DUF2062 domain-containing protein [Mucilaginibacter sp.]